MNNPIIQWLASDDMSTLESLIWAATCLLLMSLAIWLTNKEK